MGTYSKVILGCVLLLVQAFSGASAQERMMDTLCLKICFERTSATINPDYKGNEARIRAFKEELQRVSSAPGCSVSSVEICAGASPDGNTRSNQELSEARTRSLLNYFYTHLRTTTLSCKDLPSAAINATSLGEYWKGLAVALQPVREPWASQALDIVRNTPVWVLDDKGVVVDSRKNQLKMLASGVAWGYMDQHLFDEYCSVGEISIALSSSFVGTPVGEDSTLVSAALPPAGDAPQKLVSESDTLLIRFKLDSTRVDQNFDNNRERIIAFQNAFERRYAGRPKNAVQLDIYAGASPEGTTAHNVDLGRGRCEAISQLLQENLDLSSSNIIIHNQASRWKDLYDAVAASNEEWKDEVLAIIRLKPSENIYKRDHRELKLRALNGGKVWPDLLNRYLAPLRSGGSAIVSYNSEADTTSTAVLSHEIAQIAPLNDTLFLIEDKELARKHCVAMPLRRMVSGMGGCPTRIALSPEHLQSLSALMRDTLEVRFRLDSTRIDAGFAGNRLRISRFMETFSRRYAGLEPSAMRLDIYAGASPEGTADHNHWLGQERGSSIRRLLRDSLGIRVGNIEIHNLAARWDDFYDAVDASNEPWKEEVLSIIRQEPSRDTRSRDHREAKLRALRGGTVWPVLLDRYLAPLRCGSSAVLSINSQYLSQLMQNGADKGAPCGESGWQFAGDTLWICGGSTLPAQKDTVFIMQNTPYGMYPYDQYPWPILPDGYYFDENGRLRRQKVKKVVVPADKTPAWAVKTNILFWGVVAPNIQVEIPLGWRNRWSLEWEYDHPWFIWSRNSHASQILNMSLELRYYLGNRDYHRWLDGWHLGIAFGGGKYDWEWKQHEGWQGEFINAYFNVGYQHRFGKHWAVDAGLGIGVIPSRYRHYYGGSVYPDNHLEPWDIHLIWHDTGHFVFPGATHINVSISYMFNNWPLRFKTMSQRNRQEWHDTYYERIDREREQKQLRREERERKEAERENRSLEKKQSKKNKPVK